MNFSYRIRFSIISVIAFSVSALSPIISSGHTKIEKIIQTLDSHYYYPQKNGLINFSAQLKWEQLDMTLEKNIFLKKPRFKFYGEFRNRNSSKGFQINENRVTFSKDEKNQYKKILKSYLDMFMPKTLYEKFLEYKKEAKFIDHRKIILRFESSNSIDVVRSYELLVDRNKWQISELNVRQKYEPRRVKGKFRYSRKGGQWVVAETLSSFMINDQKYLEKTEYTYKNIQSFWLINKVKQRIQRGGRDILLNRFRLVNYKINSKN